MISGNQVYASQHEGISVCFSRILFLYLHGHTRSANAELGSLLLDEAPLFCCQPPFTENFSLFISAPRYKDGCINLVGCLCCALFIWLGGWNIPSMLTHTFVHGQCYTSRYVAGRHVGATVLGRFTNAIHSFSDINHASTFLSARCSHRSDHFVKDKVDSILLSVIHLLR